MRVSGPVKGVLLALLAAALVLPAAAGEGTVEGPVEKGEKPSANFGKIWTYKKSRRIRYAGYICLDKGPLEYFCCFKGGKDHESIVAAECDPVALNLALIALNYQARGGVKQVGDPGAPQGDPVFMFVEWKDDEGAVKRVRAEELLLNVRTKKHMLLTAWIYSGSSFFTDEKTGKELFAAAVTGVLSAVYRDPYAIFNSPLNTGVNDIYYEVNTDVCPKRGTKVNVIIAPATKDDVKYDDGAELPGPEPKEGEPEPEGGGEGEGAGGEEAK